MATKTRKKKSPFAPIEAAVEAIRNGHMIIVVDDEDRENEGDLTIAAEKITPEAVNFMARHGCGLICIPMTEDRLAELDLPQMVGPNTARLGTAFSVSIDAKAVTSGPFDPRSDNAGISDGRDSRRLSAPSATPGFQRASETSRSTLPGFAAERF